MSCQICCSNFNKSIHMEITCYFPSCSYSACKECIRTYLTGTTKEPHCMKCRNKWSLEFTKTSLNTSFMENDYKNHRKVVLADQEIAKIPEYYDGALRYGHLTEADVKLKQIMTTIHEHRTIIADLYVQYDNVRREMNNQSPTESTRKFVMQCQNDGCRGMLTTQYKCDICTKFTCPKCFLAIEGEKNDHVCKQEDIDTVEELRKNTRPCPNCGLRISKIDGCDQMWCIECKTAFSWNKGTIEKGVVHNPHYYQWMRQNGGLPRNPNENGDCGNEFITSLRNMNDNISDALNSRRYFTKYNDEFKELMSTFKDNKKYDNYLNTYNNVNAAVENTKSTHVEIRNLNKYLNGFHRYINHIEYTTLRPLLANIRDREQSKTAIYRYILKEIEKDELSNELIRNDMLNMKDRAHADIAEALVMVGKQMIIDCSKELDAVVSSYTNRLFINRKFENDPGITGYKFIKQFDEYKNMFFPSEMEKFQKEIEQVLVKYKVAISKYCAYSNIESIKFLITYGSKKRMVMWNYIYGCAEHHQFKSKSEMVSAIKEFQNFYNDVKPEDEDEDEDEENTFVSSDTNL